MAIELSKGSFQVKWSIGVSTPNNIFDITCRSTNTLENNNEENKNVCGVESTNSISSVIKNLI